MSDVVKYMKSIANSFKVDESGYNTKKVERGDVLLNRTLLFNPR